MKSWPRAGDRRRFDPRPLRVTVKGITVYMREYQHHSSGAEAEWRVQDEKYGNDETRGGESQGSGEKKSEDRGEA